LNIDIKITDSDESEIDIVHDTKTEIIPSDIKHKLLNSFHSRYDDIVDSY